MIFSENYTILNDFPLFWDERALKAGYHAVRYRPDMPSRFAVIPRYGETKDIRWFEAALTYVLHFSSTPMRKATRSSWTAISRRSRCPIPWPTCRKSMPSTLT